MVQHIGSRTQGIFILEGWFKMKKISIKRRKTVVAWLMILPAVLWRTATILYPMITTAWYSLLDYKMITRTKEFAGLKNYVKLFNDPAIRDSIRFTLVFTVISVISIMILGILLALMLNVKFKGKKFLRSIVLIPWAMPTIVIAIAGQWAFNDTYGFVNDIISRLTQHSCNFAWLVNPIGAQAAVIIVDVWKNVPFFAIMVLAALQSVPSELYESAAMDGAGAVKRFFTITMPHVKSVLITMGLFFTLWRLTSFDIVYAMTQGGPGAKTSLISYKITTEAFKNLNYGYASAISMLLFIVMVIVASGGLKLQKKIDY